MFEQPERSAAATVEASHRACAGCLQLFAPDAPARVRADDDSGIAWHDPECVTLWAIREGLA